MPPRLLIAASMVLAHSCAFASPLDDTAEQLLTDLKVSEYKIRESAVACSSAHRRLRISDAVTISDHEAATLRNQVIDCDNQLRRTFKDIRDRCAATFVDHDKATLVDTWYQSSMDGIAKFQDVDQDQTNVSRTLWRGLDDLIFSLQW